MVSLQTNCKTNPQKYIHLQTSDFTISSAYSLNEIISCPILDKTFPGLLGCFIFPKDAVFESKLSVQDVIEKEKRTCQRTQQKLAIFNHVTFNAVINHQEDIDDDEEDDFNDTEEEYEDEVWEEDDDNQNDGLISGTIDGHDTFDTL